MINISVLRTSVDPMQEEESLLCLQELRITTDQLFNLIRNVNALAGTAASGCVDGLLEPMPVLSARISKGGANE